MSSSQCYARGSENWRRWHCNHCKDDDRVMSENSFVVPVDCFDDHELLTVSSF